MEIQISNLKLSAKDGGGYFKHPRDTIILIDIGADSKNHLFEVDAKQLKAAIEALEKTCWRP